MRYLLFAGFGYYPDGGWDDFKGSFSSYAEAKKAADDLIAKEEGSFAQRDWAHVVDLTTMQKCYTAGKG